MKRRRRQKLSLGDASDSIVVEMKLPNDQAPWQWVVRVQTDDGSWTTAIVPGHQNRHAVAFASRRSCQTSRRFGGDAPLARRADDARARSISPISRCLSIRFPPSTSDRIQSRGPWWWVPSLYFAQALPYVFVMTVSTYAYTRLGISAAAHRLHELAGSAVDAQAAVEPAGRAVRHRAAVDLDDGVSGQRGICRASRLAIRPSIFFCGRCVGYALLALASATHDIAADGFYMRVLSPHDQTWFTGIRSVAFRGGLIFGEGLFVMLAGMLMRFKFDAGHAWAATHGVAAATFFLLATYHLVALPGSPRKSLTGEMKHSATICATIDQHLR